MLIELANSVPSAPFCAFEIQGSTSCKNLQKSGTALPCGVPSRTCPVPALLAGPVLRCKPFIRLPALYALLPEVPACETYPVVRKPRNRRTPCLVGWTIRCLSAAASARLLALTLLERKEPKIKRGALFRVLKSFSTPEDADAMRDALIEAGLLIQTGDDGYGPYEIHFEAAGIDADAVMEQLRRKLQRRRRRTRPMRRRTRSRQMQTMKSPRTLRARKRPLRR